MITFKQFIETKEVRDIPDTNLYNTLIHIQDPTICVKFAIMCAEDILPLNNQNVRESSNECINLAKQWLKNPKSVTTQQLANAYYNSYRNNYIANNSSSTYAANSARSLVEAIASIIKNESIHSFAFLINDVAYFSAYSFAHSSGHQLNSPQWEKIYNKKMQEYINKLKSMTVTRSGNLYASQNILHASQEEDIVRGLNIAFDELEDLGNYDFIYQKDNKWIFDLHYTKLEGKSRDDLINKIANDKYYLDAFRRLYYEEVKK